jgi:hypothetical protein
MKSSSLILTLSAAAALFGAAAIAEDTAGATTAPAATENPRPRRERQAMPPAAAAELKAYHERVLSIYDADKSGALEDDERDLLHEDIQAGRFEAPPRRPGRGPRGDRGPGRMGPPKEILDQYDVNKDGKLDDAERAALHADVQAGKVERPGRGPGRQGAPGRRGNRGGLPPSEPPADSDAGDNS